MSLVARIIARMGSPGLDPVRLMPKDRGLASAFGARRIETPDETEESAQALRRMDEPEQEEAQAHARRVTRAVAPEEQEAALPKSRLRRAEATPEEEEAAPRRQAETREEEEEEIQTARKGTEEPEEEAAPKRHARRAMEAEEEEEQLRARRTEEEEPEEAAPRRMAPPGERHSEEEREAATELRHEKPVNTALAKPLAACDISGSQAASYDSAAGYHSITGGQAGPSRPASGVEMPSLGPPPWPGTPAGSVLPPVQSGTAVPDRPKVVIDQIDVVIAAPERPALAAAPARGGASALLATRWLRR